jgi:hypothetical protein
MKASTQGGKVRARVRVRLGIRIGVGCESGSGIGVRVQAGTMMKVWEMSGWGLQRYTVAV